MFRQLAQIVSNTPNIKSDIDMDKVLESDNKARTLINNLDDKVKSLPNRLTESQQLNNDTEHAAKDISQSNNQCIIHIISIPNIARN